MIRGSGVNTRLMVGLVCLNEALNTSLHQLLASCLPTNWKPSRSRFGRDLANAVARVWIH